MSAPAAGGDPLAPRLSVIIPTVDEDAELPHLLDDLVGLACPHEVLVVDGQSSDRTVEVAMAKGVRVIPSERGRGAQLRIGATRARGDLLCFLHADVRLDERALLALDRLAARPPVGAVAFRLRIAAGGLVYRLIEMGTNARARWLGLPFGDQGLLLTRAVYEAADGYPDIPLMEDVAIATRLRKGPGIRLLRERIDVSARRWQREGALRRSARNFRLLFRFLKGADPGGLARNYPLHSTSSEAPSIGVFAKAPVPGRVKTRLIPALGAEGAASLYQACLRDTVALATAANPSAVVLFVDDATEGDYFAANFPDLTRIAQRGTDLGERLQAAFRQLLRRTPHALIMGSDSPTLPRARLEEADSLLARTDVVFGPALDGGYYLVGVRRSAWPAAKALFRDIPWSTAQTLAISLERAREEGLSVALLEPWYDLDEAADIPRILADAAENSHTSRILRKLESSDDVRPQASRGV